MTSSTSKYRSGLPQLANRLFLSDGGIETTLIFHHGLDLPLFAAFTLLNSPHGAAALVRYFASYVDIARRHGTGLVLETATWRASADWAAQLGYSTEQLVEANRQAIVQLVELRGQHETPATPIVISGCIGPRGDGYLPALSMNSRQAADYHHLQVETFATSAADLVTAITINDSAEAIGISLAAQQAGMPLVISFTVETDGRLPTSQPLADAIDQVDQETAGYPAYYMINCTHPTHFEHLLQSDQPWTRRLRGLRANASRKSHAELNESITLDMGDVPELAGQYRSLVEQHRQLSVLGGCCGTDHRHVEQIAVACRPLFPSA